MKSEVNEDDPYAMIMDLGGGKKKQIYFEKPETLITNAIQEELKSFAEAINKNSPSSVSLEDGHRALAVAHQILEKINLNLNVIA
jgi:predicted dehydrogenase